MNAQPHYLVSKRRADYPRVFAVVTNPAVTADAVSDDIVYNSRFPPAEAATVARLVYADTVAL